MSKIRTVLQSLSNGMAIKTIGRTHEVSKNTVKSYIRQLKDQSLSIEQALNLGSSELESLFYKVKPHGEMVLDLKGQEEYYKIELQRPHVTKQLLYEEYKENGGLLGRSRFFEELQKLNRQNKVTYTKERIAGERLEVDYAGSKLKYITDQGEEVESELLICVLPKSNLVYCEAQLNQNQESYIGGLGRCLLYIGKMPKQILSDNLKSGIKRSDRYEPSLTDLCEEASNYYGIHITATRVAKPRDKPNVERTVRIVYQRIYAKIRNRVIGSLDELNGLIREALEELNNRKINNKPSRRELYEAQEAPYMLPLKVSKLMEVKKSRICKVGKNYHVELTEDKYHYSVPYGHVGEEVKMQYSDKEVEIYHKGRRIAIHNRSKGIKRYITEELHMPPNHKAAKEVEGYTQEDLLKMAEVIGPHTKELVDKILHRNPYVSQGFKSALGVIHLHKKHGKERLEKASEKLKEFNPTYSSIRDYLEKNIDGLKVKRLEEQFIEHTNLRHIRIVN